MSKIEFIFVILFLLLMTYNLSLNKTKTMVPPEYSEYETNPQTTPQYSKYDERLKLKKETEKEIDLWKINLYNKHKPNIKKKIMKNIDKAYNNINKRIKEKKFTSKICTFDLPHYYEHLFTDYADKVKKLIIDDIVKSLNNSEKYNARIDTDVNMMTRFCYNVYNECEVHFIWK